MDLLPLLEKYGIGGVGLLVLWRVLTWLAAKGTELLGMHRRYLVTAAKQSRRQTLILRSLLTLSKEQGTVLHQHSALLKALQESPREKTQPPSPPTPATSPLPPSALRCSPFRGAPAT